MSERRGLELSFSQVAAGALATITATVVASFFGTYGTIVGAAASSVVSTAGAAIYQHFFRRTGDKLKEAGQHMSAVAMRSTLVSERGAGRAGAMSTITTPDPTRSPSQDRPPRPRDEPRPRHRPRTLADVVEGSGPVTAKAADAPSSRADRDAAPARGGADHGAASRDGGSADAKGSGAGGAASGEANRGAFSGPGAERTSRLGAFGEAPADDADAPRTPPAAGSGDADATRVHGDAAEGDDGNGTRLIGAAQEPGDSGEPEGPNETTVLDAAGTTNLAGTPDAETMAISAMTGVSEVYTAKGGDASRPTLGVMLAWARGRWVVLLGGAVLVFVVVMGAVTIAEKIMNKPLSDAVRGKTGSGTSLFSGGSGNGPTQAPTVGPSTSTSPGSTGTPTANPGQTAQNTPNPGRTAQPPGATQAPRPTGGTSRPPTPQPTSSVGGNNATPAPNGNNAQHQGQPTTAPVE